jgi:hypothetical protein
MRGAEMAGKRGLASKGRAVTLEEIRQATPEDAVLIDEIARTSVFWYEAADVILPSGRRVTGVQMRELAAEAGSEQATFGERGRVQYDSDGDPVVAMATCGACGRRWNDALITSMTPAPSARCPFEYDHDPQD